MNKTLIALLMPPAALAVLLATGSPATEVAARKGGGAGGELRQHAARKGGSNTGEFNHVLGRKGGGNTGEFRQLARAKHGKPRVTRFRRVP